MPMSAKDEYCQVCGSQATESHHIVKRSEVKALIKCEINQAFLCTECHRGTYGVHGKEGHKLDIKLKLEMQNKLELIFDKEWFTREDIRQALKISERATDNLFKLMKSDKGMFNRLEIVRICMGGRLIESESDNNE
jgi:hypothetical protein